LRQLQDTLLAASITRRPFPRSFAVCTLKISAFHCESRGSFQAHCWQHEVTKEVMKNTKDVSLGPFAGTLTIMGSALVRDSDPKAVMLGHAAFACSVLLAGWALLRWRRTRQVLRTMQDMTPQQPQVIVPDPTDVRSADP
jgi:hypothetical protein